jgi:hypothetical protein
MRRKMRVNAAEKSPPAALILYSFMSGSVIPPPIALRLQ